MSARAKSRRPRERSELADAPKARRGSTDPPEPASGGDGDTPPGGRVSVDDGVMLCGFHHRNFETQGWSVTMTGGRPWWTPPRWLDPAQTPRRNHMHDHDIPDTDDP